MGKATGMMRTWGLGLLLVLTSPLAGWAAPFPSPAAEVAAGPVEALAVADLSLSQTDSDDPVVVGGSLLYTLVVTNNGPDSATGVTLVDNLSNGVSLQAVSVSQGIWSGTSVITCNLGTILDGGTATVEILVTPTRTGTVNNVARVSADSVDGSPSDNVDTETTRVIDAGTTDIPLTYYEQVHGYIDFTTTGGSLRTRSNAVDPCAVRGSSTALLSGIPATGTVRSAYLYWAGSGSSVDDVVSLDGIDVTADRVFRSTFVLGATAYDFFGGFKDVTAAVRAKGNGSYTFSGLTFNTGSPHCGVQAVLGGWSLIVIYEDSGLSGKTLVLYDGFDLERNGSTTYMLSGIYAAAPTEAKTALLVWEGDESLGGANESIEFNGIRQSDAYNPVNNVYNGSINSLGIDDAYGLDLDTFDVSSLVREGDTFVSTRLLTGPDLVILNAVVLEAKTNVVAGTVFEDVNYGGGPGRGPGAAAAAAPGFTTPRAGATIELYDAAGNLFRTTATKSDGTFGFAGLADGKYLVRAVNSTVVSCRAGATGSEWPVQTYRAGGGLLLPVTDEIGGADPAAQDAPVNTTNANLFDIVAQSVTPVSLNVSQSAASIDFGFNFDTVVNTNSDGQGSLRQFMLNANALANTTLAQAGRTAGLDNALFMIPASDLGHDGTGHGEFTIVPDTALPTLTDPAVIDGGTQPGYGGVPLIELDGFRAGAGVVGLHVIGGGTTLARLVVNRFGSDGIHLSGNPGNALLGCWIGTDVGGTVARGNAGAGLRIANNDNKIGDGTAAGRNVFSGNGTHGIRFTNNATGNIVAGNLIGTDASGLVALGNATAGIRLAARAGDNTIGGTAAGEGNVISGNRYGVMFQGADGNRVQGNLVGADLNGTADLGNERDGIWMRRGSSGNAIGGTASGAGNLIAFNGGAGVALESGASTGNALLGNSIHGNAGLGIDLSRDGVTPNDPLDADTGANELQNHPVVSSARSDGSTITIRGVLDSAPDTAYRVEFFANDSLDPSGHGEGRTFLAHADVTTDGSGRAVIGATFSVAVPLGDHISATATDPLNNTSEFGGDEIVLGLPDLLLLRSVTTLSDPVSLTDKPKAIPGAEVLHTIVATNQGDGPLDDDSVVVTNAVPPGSPMFVGDLGAAGSGPVLFEDGTPSSGLTFDFTALDSPGDDLEFSADGGATFAYAPAPGPGGYDASVTHWRIRPSGTFPASGGAPHPGFSLRFKVRVP